MGFNRTPRRFDLSGVWIEWVLIIILVALIVAIAISLLGPYISNQVTIFMTDIASRTGK